MQACIFGARNFGLLLQRRIIVIGARQYSDHVLDRASGFRRSVYGLGLGGALVLDAQM